MLIHDNTTRMSMFSTAKPVLKLVIFNERLDNGVSKNINVAHSQKIIYTSEQSVTRAEWMYATWFLNNCEPERVSTVESIICAG